MRTLSDSKAVFILFFPHYGIVRTILVMIIISIVLNNHDYSDNENVVIKRIK